MEIIMIKADVREKIGSKEAQRLRKSNLVPAVLYGGKDKNQLLSIPKKEAWKLLGHGTRLIDLAFSNKTERVLVKDLKYNTVDEAIIHIDFARVAMDELLSISVAIILKGTPKGAKEGGVLEHNLRNLNVKCLPAAIPEKIELDISGLEVGDILRVKDLKLPEGVTTTVALDIAVAGVHMPKVEEVAPVAAEVTTAEPEVITAKKPEEETAEGATDKGAAPVKEKEHKEKDKEPKK